MAPWGATGAAALRAAPERATCQPCACSCATWLCFSGADRHRAAGGRRGPSRVIKPAYRRLPTYVIPCSGSLQVSLIYVLGHIAEILPSPMVIFTYLFSNFEP